MAKSIVSICVDFQRFKSIPVKKIRKEKKTKKTKQKKHEKQNDSIAII